MNLDYDDFAEGGGSMSIRKHSTWLPPRLYKQTAQFHRKQMWKPQQDTRNPSGTASKRWEAYGGTFVETRGTRSWFGQCACGCWIYSQRDVSTPEFRGKGNRGPGGRPPKYCALCRERRSEERRAQAKEGMRRLRRGERRREFEYRGERPPSDW